MNKVILLGNLGSDPEVRSVGKDSKVANFSLATTRKYKTKDGEKKESTQWHRVAVWGAAAGVAESYLYKGDKVLVEGEIEYGSYEDKDGNTRYTTTIRVSNGGLTMLRSSGGSSEEEAPY